MVVVGIRQLPIQSGSKLIQKQLDRGAGWVNLHYAVEYPAKVGETVQSWLGGYYETGFSINPHWDAEIRSLPKHPITLGVKPFTIRDEWYYNMRFVDDLKGITPILQALPPDNTRGTPAAKARKGEIETMAWALSGKMAVGVSGSPVDIFTGTGQTRISAGWL